MDENDILRDEGEAYARKLMQADVEVSAVRVLATIHDFALLNALADTQLNWQFNWLHRNLLKLSARPPKLDRYDDDSEP